MTVESTKTNGLKTSELGTEYKPEYDENLTILDVHLGASGVHGLTGSVVGDTDTQTLTNKTINDPSNTIHADAVHTQVRNVSGSTLVSGTPVYASGYNVGQDRVEVAMADSDNASAMPAIGIVDGDIATAANGHIISSGVMNSIDTASWSVGNLLYVSTTAGTLTNSKPTGASELIQAIAKIIRSHASMGRIIVQGAGRSNEFPNTVLPDAQTPAATVTHIASDGSGHADVATNSTHVAANPTSLQGSTAGNLIRKFDLTIARDTSGANGIKCNIVTSLGRGFNISANASTTTSAVFAKGSSASVGSGAQAVTYSLNATGFIVTVDFAHDVSNILFATIAFNNGGTNLLASLDVQSNNFNFNIKDASSGANFDLTSMVNGKVIQVSGMYVVGGAA